MHIVLLSVKPSPFLFPSVARSQAFIYTLYTSLQLEALPLQVCGSIPSWLHGDYIRNGPGTFKGMKHLFDGYGMLVKFSFESGKVTTQQRCGSCLQT